MARVEMYMSQEIIDQIDSWSSNATPFEVWSVTWSHPLFFERVALFCGVIALFWATAILLMGFPKDLIIEHATSLIHASLTCVVSALFLFNHSELELVQMHIARQKNTPFEIHRDPTLHAMQTFLAFQSAYCIMDALQLIMAIVVQRNRIIYRVPLVVHHLLMGAVCSGIYFFDPVMHHHYARFVLHSDL